ncbi:MAG TPA: zinc ribbon domain-containing protein [Ruminococcus sp.]|jgi:ribosomal protein L40E|nr:zinc ribbon domain-containing protein [Ruminococcus flavefaciens]HRU97361.1 zinc ribbon domain-containing protein [Ruminococcus sp.]
MGFMDSLKGLADKVGDTVEKGVKTGSDGYKKMTEKARIKKEITQAESAIQDAYVEIGKKFAAENPEAEGFMDFFTAIADSKAKIEALNAELFDLEDKITCKGCGASVDKNAKFCAKCGTKVEIEVPAETVAEEAETAEAPAEKKVCSNCGAELAEGAKFCEKCGTENE